VPGTIDATGALWFTESSSNKIARIGVSGSVTEIAVPTASARPTGIIPCPTTVCGAHGGVWFAEPGVKRIARYDFP
jgi:virginiamycin B lyase